ncbi:MAG: nucleotidyltransferase domain-containing protein [Methanoregula sp.]|jgi:predicted nucleotidyltransferase|uniref:nucleotidyltransferase domain-containing protein n=1 Tax=Methanoregula sp. TaxID=2052170 RepID=UPI003C24E492
MVDAKVLEAVNFFRASVRKNGIRIHDLILFGSSGLGTATPDSDIDIAVISGDFAGKDIFERALMTKDAEILTVRKFKVALDVLTLTPEEYRDPASLIAGTIRKGIIVPPISSA